MKYHSTMLVPLGYRASADPSARVRSMIEEMFANFCKKQLSKFSVMRRCEGIAPCQDTSAP